MNDDELERLNRELQRQMEQTNNTPAPEREGLTPKEMYQLIHYPFAPQNWFGLRPDLSDATIERMPVIRVVVAMLKSTAEGKGLKLTAKGNLPRKLLHALYAEEGMLDRSDWEGKPPNKEEDWPLMVGVHFMLKELDWVKYTGSYMTLTEEGKRQLAGPRRELFEAFVWMNLFQMNLGWADLYNDTPSLQRCINYVLFLLHRHGETVKQDTFYAEAFLRAFSMILDEIGNPDSGSETAASVFPRLFSLRVFSRCFLGYGWIEYQGEMKLLEPEAVTATELFYDLFEIREAEALPPDEEAADKAITSALFDAEMGSTSHYSDELPLEVMKEFHDQIREFHAGEPRTPQEIRSFLPQDFHLLPPDEVAEEAIAQREIDRVLEALEKEAVVVLPPDHLTAVEYYTVLHDVILPEEIIPFGAGMPIYLPYEDFAEEPAVNQEDWPPEMQAAEVFLFALLNLDEPFPKQLLADEVRLGGKVVSREKAFRHLQAWRAQFRDIERLAFGPGIVENDDDGTFFPLFLVAYRTVTLAGEEVVQEGPGVVQLLLDKTTQAFQVQGAQFPGFEF